MINLNLIEKQPRWRIWLLAWFSRILGVYFHVEGIPFGSSRLYSKRAKDQVDDGPQESCQIGGSVGVASKEI